MQRFLLFFKKIIAALDDPRLLRRVIDNRHREKGACFLRRLDADCETVGLPLGVRDQTDQPVLYIRTTIDPSRGDADLASITKYRPEQLLGDCLYVHISQHDRGIVAGNSSATRFRVEAAQGITRRPSRSIQ